MDDEFFNRVNYETVGGSPILGINDNAIIGHGVSTPRNGQSLTPNTW